MVSPSQAFSGPRWFFFSAWWAKVTVKLELTSRMVLISGRCHASMTPFGGGKSFGSGVFSSGHSAWNCGQSMCEMPWWPSPPSHGTAKWRT
ncbi:hypothetical protein D3C76_1175340 [compost metagenome]